MEINEQNLSALSHYLSETSVADATRRKAAEQYLNNLGGQPGFCLLVLHLLQRNEIDMGVRQAAAVFFKNFVKQQWSNRESNVISAQDRAQIKSIIVDLMLSVPSVLYKQLAATLEIISNTDFPKEWSDLLPGLISKFQTQNFGVINGVLRTLNSIFKRYRHMMKSPTVLEELKYVLEQFQEPLLQLFLVLFLFSLTPQATMTFVESNKNNPDAIVEPFKAIKSMLKIFYSLNCIDLPEYFEDHMGEWMTQFKKLLLWDSKPVQLIGDEDDDDPGLLHKIQALVCHNINLYIGKYEEEFAPFYESFLRDVWTLLGQLNNNPKFDKLVTAAIQFLSTASTSVHYGVFAEPSVLKMICENIVIPNMKLREVDIEVFEDNPVEYIRRDMEGSDTDTRRRAATELIKGLRRHFEAETTSICASYVEGMLSQYSSNPSNAWQAKDAAVFLVTALAVRSGTQAHGTTAVSALVPVAQFAADHVLPELANPHPPSLILQAGALKFISTFRQYLSKETYAHIFPLLQQSLLSPNFVVQSYSGVCIDRLLTVKDDRVLRFGKADLKPHLPGLLQNMYRVFAVTQVGENDYVMKALMRVISVGQEDVTPFVQECLQNLVTVLGRVYKNPTNPTFNHYLFESISALVKSVCSQNPGAVAEFEKQLFPPFQAILQADVQEFAPYLFQILSMLLEMNPAEELPSTSMSILPPLLVPALWERSGNIPALVRLLQAFFLKASKLLVSNNYLEPILGIFQKLVASKIHDHEGFYLLESLVEHLPLSDFSRYMPTVLTLLFTRIQKDKTLKFIKSLIVFFSLFIGKHGATDVLQQVDAVQKENILTSLFLPNVQKVNGLIERKMAAIALTKLLTECPQMTQPPYLESWGLTLRTLMGLLEGPEDESVPADVEDIEIEDTMGYSAAYSQLVHAAKQDIDPFKDVNPKHFLAASLYRFTHENPGKFGPTIEQSLGEGMGVLTQYFQQLPHLSPPFLC